MFSSNTSNIEGGYQISRSLRFNSADTAYLNRTPASAGNRKTWTWSGWLKRSVLTFYTFFAAGDGSGGNRAAIDFDSDQVRVIFGDGTILLGSTQVFRDPSAWYHFVFAIDTTQATSANRVRMYVNGSEITAFSTATYPNQNYDTFVNATNQHVLGARYRTSVDGYFDGYITEVNFIDGQQLTPSSFGETNAQTGVWQPKAYSGSYGTNGFYVNFSDNSNTTAATLGKDYSGNGNNWTPNNFSVAAGAGNDSLVDVPTPYGVDTGAGGNVRGNYATLNPLDTGATGSTISDGNLKVVTSTSAYSYMGNTIWVSSGKFYAEFKITASSGYAQVGIAVKTASTNKILGVDSDSWSYDGWDGSYGNNGSFPAYGSSFGAGDTIGIAIDKDNNKLYFSKNGTWQNSSDPAAGTGSLNISGISGIPTMIAVCDNDAGGSCTFEANFGQRPFAYTAPSGYKALCTQNLPTPTIGATTATQAGKYFNPVLYTGNSTTRSITDVGFQPDFVWVKSRTNPGSGYFNFLMDSVRGKLSGYYKNLYSNSTEAEDTYPGATYGGITSFDTNGFTLAPVSGTNFLNENTYTYVAWNWKANGSGSSNTAGSITSTVSANTTSGFSVVNASLPVSTTLSTIGHGLGVKPAMVLAKNRDAADNWFVWHQSLSSQTDSYLNLNLTNAASTYPSIWGNGMTSTAIGVRPATFGSATQNMIFYVFAEVPGFSRFGSYTGNGSSDGPFVFTGFRPAYVMIKRTDVSDSWYVYDATRNTFNSLTSTLEANTSSAEFAFTFGDYLSNGFKVRNTATGMNGNGGTFIYMAFASNPFKYSLAR